MEGTDILTYKRIKMPRIVNKKAYRRIKKNIEEAFLVIEFIKNFGRLSSKFPGLFIILGRR